MSLLFCFLCVCLIFFFFKRAETGRPVSALRSCLAGPDCPRRARGTIRFVAGHARNVGGTRRKPLLLYFSSSFLPAIQIKMELLLCFSHSLVSLQLWLPTFAFFPSTSTEYKWLRGSERAAKSSPVFFVTCVTLSPLRPNIYRYRKHKKLNRTATIGYFPQLYSLGCYICSSCKFWGKILIIIKKNENNWGSIWEAPLKGCQNFVARVVASSCCVSSCPWRTTQPS